MSILSHFEIFKQHFKYCTICRYAEYCNIGKAYAQPLINKLEQLRTFPQKDKKK